METSLLRALQMQDSERFRHKNDIKTPEYRKINTYTKSIEQYWKERNRRKQAWELSGKGFTYKQIAEKLGVSERTIKRDMRKLRRHYIGQFNKKKRAIFEKQRNQVSQLLEGLSLSQRFHVLTGLMVEQRKRQRANEYKRHLMKIIVDMDDMKHGVFPTLKVWPKHIRQIIMPLQVRFILARALV